MVAPSRSTPIADRTVALKSVPIFTLMNDEELEIIRSLAVEKSYPKHAVVLTEGEIGDSLYMVETGRVKVFIGDEDGREIILKILGPGDCFGEMSVIDQQPRSASVTTLEPATFLILSHGAFEQCVDRAPRIAKLVLRVLAQRVREADRKIGTLALMDVYGRVASTLLELAVYREGGNSRLMMVMDFDSTAMKPRSERSFRMRFTISREAPTMLARSCCESLSLTTSLPLLLTASSSSVLATRP